MLVLCMIVGVFSLTSCKKDGTPVDATNVDTATTTDIRGTNNQEPGSEPGTNPNPEPIMTVSKFAEVVYDVVKAYYDEHNAVDNFGDITATSTDLTEQEEEIELEYKDNPADSSEEPKTAKRINTFIENETITFKTKSTAEAFSVEVTMTKVTSYNTYTSQFYEIKNSNTTEYEVTTWTLTKINEKYYYICVKEETDGEGQKTTQKGYYEFSSKDEYNQAVESLLRQFNNRVMHLGFFVWMEFCGELQVFSETPGILTFSVNGSAYTVSAKATRYQIIDRYTGETRVHYLDTTVAFAEGKAVGAQYKESEREGEWRMESTTNNLTITYSSELSDTVAAPDSTFEAIDWSPYEIMFPVAKSFATP